MTRDLNKFFLAIDFKAINPDAPLYPDMGCNQYIADQANEILRDYFEQLPKIYGRKHPNTTCVKGLWEWGEECDPGDTHTARLIGMEELK